MVGWAGLVSSPSFSHNSSWLTQTQAEEVERVAFTRLAADPSPFLSAAAAVAWANRQVFTVAGIAFGIKAGGYDILATPDSAKLFDGWSSVSPRFDSATDVEQNMTTLYPSFGWGLASWTHGHPGNQLPKVLISTQNAEYNDRIIKTALALLSNLHLVPTIYRSQLMAVAWERFGILLDRDDSHVLLQTAFHARERKLPMASATDVSDANKARYARKAQDKALQRRATILMDGIAAYGAPLPALPNGLLNDVIMNSWHAHFERYSLSASGIKRLHAAGRDVDAETLSADSYNKILNEDREAIQREGCSAAACVYNGGPWIPAEGGRSPYSAADDVRYVCLHHLQLELFCKL